MPRRVNTEWDKAAMKRIHKERKDLLQILTAVRGAQGLTMRAAQEKYGMPYTFLAYLEGFRNADKPQPSIDTILRALQTLEMDFEITVFPKKEGKPAHD